MGKNYSYTEEDLGNKYSQEEDNQENGNINQSDEDTYDPMSDF